MPPFPCLVALLSFLDSPVPGTGALTADQVHLIIWGFAVLVFNSLVSFVALVFGGIRAFRRTPPLHETFATKSELAQLTGRVEKLDTSIESRLKEIFESLRGINRALGRVEGIEKSMELVAENTTERLKEINGRLSSIEARIAT